MAPYEDGPSIYPPHHKGFPDDAGVSSGCTIYLKSIFYSQVKLKRLIRGRIIRFLKNAYDGNWAFALP
jgi:hypothetical protein